MKNGLTKLQKEIYPIMLNECLCARQIVQRVNIDRTDIGDNRTLIKSSVTTTLRGLLSDQCIERQVESDSLQSIYYKVLPKYAQEMEDKDVPRKAGVLFITASMDLLGKRWVA